MCYICDNWKANKITSKQAFELIQDAMHNVDNKKNIGHLTYLSDIIIDRDVPMQERDEYTDRIWGESYNHKE